MRSTKITKEVLQFSNASNPTDSVSILRSIDCGRHIKSIKRPAQKIEAFFNRLHDEYIGDLSNKRTSETMIDKLP